MEDRTRDPDGQTKDRVNSQGSIHVKGTSVGKENQLLARPAPFLSAFGTLTFSGFTENST